MIMKKKTYRGLHQKPANILKRSETEALVTLSDRSSSHDFIVPACCVVIKTTYQSESDQMQNPQKPAAVNITLVLFQPFQAT